MHPVDSLLRLFALTLLGPLAIRAGTFSRPVQQDLRWGCATKIADDICNFNRHYAERAGYWERSTQFLKEEGMTTGAVQFYDSNTGHQLFQAPIGRSWESFVRESRQHGWPSFRDEEVCARLPNAQSECAKRPQRHRS